MSLVRTWSRKFPAVNGTSSWILNPILIAFGLPLTPTSISPFLTFRSFHSELGGLTHLKGSLFESFAISGREKVVPQAKASSSQMVTWSGLKRDLCKIVRKLDSMFGFIFLL